MLFYACCCFFCLAQSQQQAKIDNKNALLLESSRDAVIAELKSIQVSTLFIKLMHGHDDMHDGWMTHTHAFRFQIPVSCYILNPSSIISIRSQSNWTDGFQRWKSKFHVSLPDHVSIIQPFSIKTIHALSPRSIKRLSPCITCTWNGRMSHLMNRLLYSGVF